MNLEAWLKQDRSLPDQLKVMEGICDALNEAHGRAILHRALEPFNIEVEGDGSCDLKGAIHADAATAAAAARYRAPEVLEGSSYSPQADIYAVGVIFYEMLSGKSPSGSDRPTPLVDLRPDISRDLTDAIMGCLEKGPDWRPKDLSYLLQVVRTMRASGTKGSSRPASRPAPESVSRPTIARTPSPTPRRSGGGRSPRASSGSPVPLIAGALVLLVGAGVGAYLWLQGPRDTKVARGGPLATPPPATPTPTPDAAPSEVARPTPVAGKATPTPPPVVATAPPVAAAPTPLPTPTPTAIAAVATPSPVRPPTPEPVKPEATPTPAVATPPPAAAPEGPPMLTAISPLALKRGQTTILDVRGTNLRADLQLRIVKVKGGAHASGFSIARQRLFNPTLLQILVKLDESADAGAYVASVVDPQGATSNGLPITITK
jgi:hypothetical protein